MLWLIIWSCNIPFDIVFCVHYFRWKWLSTKERQTSLTSCEDWITTRRLLSGNPSGPSGHISSKSTKGTFMFCVPKFMFNCDITLITNWFKSFPNRGGLLIIFYYEAHSIVLPAFYRIKTELAEAERLVGRLQVLKDEEAQQEPVPVDPNQANAAKPACCICLIRPRNTVFVPCGHLNVCDTCAGILEASRVEGKPEGYYLCPICRSQVLTRQIVFGV